MTPNCPLALRDRSAADETSLIGTVRSYLGRWMRILLSDGRQIVGTFVQLDHTGTLMLNKTVTISGAREQPLGVVKVSLAHVQSIELLTDGW
jgi:small nuclear ribonucleoprotein (snRNP)-like protein